ncbi:MFS transporter permease [Klebsiella pneumoniae]|uniref:MFS transporter permease n=1 Tax=Klebsiella pneumoniae TaxID=573 RepID=A0A2X3H9F7_KLEPN|nr:MFS transporter permease [Klebsiella pneumoniae]
MTTLETNAAPAEASGEGVRTPEKAVRWAIPLSLLACVLLAFFDKISIAALFSDSHFQQAMGIDFDTTRLGILMSAFLLSYGFSSVLLSGLGDRIAPLRLLTGMMVVWCILMVIMGFTHNYALMVTLRILLGIAEGPLFPLAFARGAPHPSRSGYRPAPPCCGCSARRLARRWVSAVNLATQYLRLAEHIFRDGDADDTGADFCTHRAARRTTGGESEQR